MSHESDVDAWLAAMPGGPYEFSTAPEHLYSIPQLYKGFDPREPGSLEKALDSKITYWLTHGTSPARKLSIAETIATRLHDTAIDRLNADFLRRFATSVAMMGSHSIARDNKAFVQFARIARGLRRKGYMVVSGGGPGLMEAANFGAFLAPCSDAVFEEAHKRLCRSLVYTDGEAWVRAGAEARAFALSQMPGGDVSASWTDHPPEEAWSLGVPTWYFGMETPNLFVSHVGKYFFNSLREDGLVSMANGGIVFGMGEAGTVQEVFQNATLNYYRGRKAATPMVFVGSDYWNPAIADPPRTGKTVDLRPKPVIPLIKYLGAQANPAFPVSLADSVGDVVGLIEKANSPAPAGPREADAKLR